MVLIYKAFINGTFNQIVLLESTSELKDLQIYITTTNYGCGVLNSVTGKWVMSCPKIWQVSCFSNLKRTCEDDAGFWRQTVTLCFCAVHWADGPRSSVWSAVAGNCPMNTHHRTDHLCKWLSTRPSPYRSACAIRLSPRCLEQSGSCD